MEIFFEAEKIKKKLFIFIILVAVWYKYQRVEEDKNIAKRFVSNFAEFSKRHYLVSVYKVGNFQEYSSSCSITRLARDECQEFTCVND